MSILTLSSPYPCSTRLRITTEISWLRNASAVLLSDLPRWEDLCLEIERLASLELSAALSMADAVEGGCGPFTCTFPVSLLACSSVVSDNKPGLGVIDGLGRPFLSSGMRIVDAGLYFLPGAKKVEGSGKCDC